MATDECSVAHRPSQQHIPHAKDAGYATPIGQFTFTPYGCS
jgi:hypothetical protein